MNAPKAFFKDCLQVELYSNEGLIRMDCGMVCYKCGFNRYVAADRLRRIREGDLRERQGKKGPIKYLYVGQEENESEQSDTHGEAHA